MIFIPDTICHLSRLKHIDLSYNHLRSMTPYLGHLSRLQSIHLQHNQLSQLPFTLEGLSSLVSLDVSFNPISLLPAQIIQLPYLRQLGLEGCPLATSLDHFDRSQPTPSLLEICARTLIGHGQKGTLPETLERYLARVQTCHHCQGPFFDSFVSRGRWIERNELWIPLEYRLCSPHWSTESDRLLATFADQTRLFHPQNQPLFKKWKHKIKKS